MSVYGVLIFLLLILVFALGKDLRDAQRMLADYREKFRKIEESGLPRRLL